MSAAIPITRTDRTAAELRNFASRCGDGAQVRRLLAIALVLDGRSRAEAAGQNGIAPPPGAAPLLNEDQNAELKALVLAGPDPKKDKVIRWRCLDLQEEIARRFSVRVHESTVGKWLRRLGLTRLQARPCHPKTDLAGQDTYKKTSPA